MRTEEFDKVINRRNTDCAKWDEMDEKYEEYGRKDLIHLGVADMDFQPPKPIREAFAEQAQHGVFGYTNVGKEFYSSIRRWIKKQIGEEIPEEWIVFSPRINIACGLSVEAFTKPGEKVIMFAPYYMPLYDSVVKNHREVLSSPLKLKDGRYEIDFEGLEGRVDDKTRMVILCNPHNPCCRSWTEGELKQLAEFCDQHNLILFSDEIHSDIRPSGLRFVSTLNLSGGLRNRLIYANSPTKAFNIPGVIVSYMIIPNPDLRNLVKREIDRVGMHNPTVFANKAVRVAYTECDEWLDAMNVYIDENETFVREYLEKYMPKFKPLKREGTYLLWIDCREFGLSNEELEEWFIKEAGVGVYMGSTFGVNGIDFIRWNLGTARSVLEEALNRMKGVYKTID